MATNKQNPEQDQAPGQQAANQQTPAVLDTQLPKKLADLLASVTEKDLRGPATDAETLKGNVTTPGVWVHSPAVFKFSALAQRRLTKVARAASMGDIRVARVHAKFVGNSNTVLIKAADPLDLTAYPVGYYPGAAGGVVNLYTLLGPARATVETGYRQRYDVYMVPKGSPGWPGLLVDMDEPKERKKEPERKKQEPSSTDKTKGTDKMKGTNGTTGNTDTNSATKGETSST